MTYEDSCHCPRVVRTRPAMSGFPGTLPRSQESSRCHHADGRKQGGWILLTNYPQKTTTYEDSCHCPRVPRTRPVMPGFPGTALGMRRQQHALATNLSYRPHSIPTSHRSRCILLMPCPPWSCQWRSRHARQIRSDRATPSMYIYVVVSEYMSQHPSFTHTIARHAENRTNHSLIPRALSSFAQPEAHRKRTRQTN